MGIPKGKIVVMCSLCYHRLYKPSSFLNTDNFQCPRCGRGYMRWFDTFTTPERVEAAKKELEESLRKMDRSNAARRGADTRRMNATMHKYYGNRLEDGFNAINGNQI